MSMKQLRVIVACEESQTVCKAFRKLGHEAQKKTCLWLSNLPNLKPTDIVNKGEIITFKSGKKMSKWYANSYGNGKKRSVTFQGIADAMATQWSEYILSNDKQCQ